MSKNPYEILGVTTSSTREEIDNAYYTLRDKYRLDMHSEGEKGKIAAQKLNEVEEAYRSLIIDYTGEPLKSDTTDYTYSEPITTEPIVGETPFAQVERLVREKNYGEAQKVLDNMSERNAEWHFYQSAIYYKQGWLNESKAQLEMACNMDPTNKKYSDSLAKLNQKLSSSRTQNVNNTSTNGYNRSYAGSDYDARRTEDSCCHACQAMICINCLCDCCCHG